MRLLRRTGGTRHTLSPYPLRGKLVLARGLAMKGAGMALVRTASLVLCLLLVACRLVPDAVPSPVAQGVTPAMPSLGPAVPASGTAVAPGATPPSTLGATAAPP